MEQFVIKNGQLVKQVTTETLVVQSIQDLFAAKAMAERSVVHGPLLSLDMGSLYLILPMVGPILFGAIRLTHINFVCTWATVEYPFGTALVPIMQNNGECRMPVNPNQENKMLLWKVPSEVSMWLVTNFATGTLALCTYLRVNPDGALPNFIRFPLPNTYPDGRICCDLTPDAKAIVARKPIGDYAAALANNWFNSVWNRDLYQESLFKNMFVWNLAGEQQPAQAAIYPTIPVLAGTPPELVPIFRALRATEYKGRLQ